MRRLIALAGLCLSGVAGAADLPIFDAHLHYSHDAWESTRALFAALGDQESGVDRLIDATGLPAGSTLQLNNVDFAAIVGAKHAIATSS